MLLPNPNAITEAYLQGLCDDATSESQTLEFKLELPPPSDKYELQKDLCALANADGGDLVFGVAEAAGAASKLMSLPTSSVDAARRRITQALDKIERRIQGTRMHEVQAGGGVILVVRVPPSFDGPHSYRVDGNARKFVMRNGTDTTDMNFDQIRSAFDRTATLAERARDFIQRCFDEFARGVTWKPFAKGPMCVVALAPIAGIAGRASIDIAALNNAFSGFTFPDWSGANRTMNIDGLVVYPPLGAEGRAVAYTQVYRNGAVVALRTGASRRDPEVIPSTDVTKFYREAIKKAVHECRKLGFTGPAVLTAAMFRVDNCRFAVGDTGDAGVPLVADAVDRHSLVLPDVWVSALEEVDTDEQIDGLARPMLDVLWQAFDVERCFEFDLAGKWAPRP